MDSLQLLVDLHQDGERQGPGGDAETLRALAITGLDSSRPLAVADIGCGTGAASLVLARELNAQITAVDLFPEFLDRLQARSADQGLANKIQTRQADMTALPFEEQTLDLIWSEGAIYNMGFKQGITAWRPFLKPGGSLVVSEITWLTATRPAAIQAHWDAEYPEIDLASAKIALLEQAGYRLDGYFVLPSHCWLQNFYDPLQAGFEGFLERQGQTEEAKQAAKAIIKAERQEIDLYQTFGAYYSYGVYIASRAEID